MSASIPSEWLSDPPQTLVVGDGPFGKALAAVLGVTYLPLRQLCDGREIKSGGRYPQVLENLKRVVLVVSENMAAPEALQCHQSVLKLVAILSSGGDQHNLGFCFILPTGASKEFEDALAIGLSIPKINPATTGCAVWRRSGSLSELLNLLVGTGTDDLLSLQARRSRDIRHTALTRLRAAIAHDDLPMIKSSVDEVLQAFPEGKRHLLDVFCRDPSHPNANLFRQWLTRIVTEGVTPELCATAKNDTPSWLK